MEVSNQTVKQFEAQYRNAVALVQGAQANLFPVVGVNASVTERSGFGGSGSSGSNIINSTGIATNTTGNGVSGGGGGSAGAPRTQYSLEGTADWDSRRLGRRSPPGGEPGGWRAGQCSRSCECATVGTGNAGYGLF